MHEIGIDLIEIYRVEAALSRWGERFQNRVYTAAEREHCRGRVPEMAVRFAAKEAVMKTLGTGMKGVGWREIEVLNNDDGKPFVRLHGHAKRKADEIGLRNVAISLSHSRDYAIASVIGEVQ
ncbi:MAG: holo-ACP synthase [Chloroflexota bacterium]|nr:holo-ACP synthase [Chloroflexota bacterium]